jgi:hypothetical protein
MTDRTAGEAVVDLQDQARALLAGLTALRLDLDLLCEEHSQAEVARLIGVHDSTILRWRAGSLSSAASLRRLMRRCGG